MMVVLNAAVDFSEMVRVFLEKYLADKYYLAVLFPTGLPPKGLPIFMIVFWLCIISVQFSFT